MIKFGTSGWRGITADDFTYENVRRVVTAIGTMLLEKEPQPRIVIGYDPRFLSPEFSLEASLVLATMGVKSFLVTRTTPTPALSWFCRDNRLSGIINFTASHNPAEYNGLKFSGADGAPAIPEVTKRIEELIPQVEPVNAMNKKEAFDSQMVQSVDPKDEYLLAVKGMLLADKIKPFPVVIDHLYGASVGYPEQLLFDLGFDIASLHSRRDVLFGGMRPEPEGHSIRELQEIVVKNGFKLGIACDGDADRFGIVDSDGAFITPNEFIAVLTRHLSRSRGWRNVVVRTNATTHLIDRVARRESMNVLEVPVGFKFIGAVMEKQDITIGGEESGGLSVKGWVPEKDGILAVLLAVEMVAATGKTIGQLLEEIYADCGRVFSTRIDLRMTPEKRDAFIKFWKEFDESDIAGFRVISKDQFDGPRVVMEEDRWILIRPSGTEPVVRCYLEADSKENLDKLSNFLLQSASLE